MKTLLEKVLECAPLINLHESNEDQIKFIWECLETLGVTDDDFSHELLLSKDCKEGDGRKVFCDDNNLAVPRFRRMWRIFKDNGEEPDLPEGDNKIVFKEMVPIGNWSDKQLLESYGAECPSNVEVELKTRSELKPCIVFNNDKDINVEESIKLLRAARRRETPSVMTINDKITKIYRIGEFPETVYTKCPVTGCVLFEGYSEQLGMKWDIDMEGMQFIALLKDGGVALDVISIRNICQEYKDKGIVGLKNLFPKFGNDFDDLKSIDMLPRLKTHSTIRKAKDPLGKRY